MPSRIAEVLRDQASIFSGVVEKLQTVWGVLVTMGLIALSFVDHHVGGVTDRMGILFKLQVVGFFFGILAALLGKGKHHPTFRSDIGIQGLNRKVAMWGWIWLGHQVDQGVGSPIGPHAIRDAFVIGYIVYEAASLAETWVNLKWFGHRALEMLLVWRIESLKQWAIDKIKPKEATKEDATGK